MFITIVKKNHAVGRGLVRIYNVAEIYFSYRFDNFLKVVKSE
jgi:hypothetical protein